MYSNQRSLLHAIIIRSPFFHCVSFYWLALLISVYKSLTNLTQPIDFCRSSSARRCDFADFFPDHFSSRNESDEREKKKLFTNSAPGRTDTTWMVSMSNGTVSLCTIFTRNCDKIVSLDIRRSHFPAHIGVKLTCESPNFRTLNNFFLSSFVRKKESLWESGKGLLSGRLVEFLRRFHLNIHSTLVKFMLVLTFRHFVSQKIKSLDERAEPNSLFSFATNVKFLFHFRLGKSFVWSESARRAHARRLPFSPPTWSFAESFLRWCSMVTFSCCHQACNVDGSFIWKSNY